MASSEQEAIARLAEAGRRIDEIAARVRSARADTRVRVMHRVGTLRAREAAARSTLSWRGHAADLSRQLDEIDVEIAIGQAQLEIDTAQDPATFQAAVERQIQGYRDHAVLLRLRAVHADTGTRTRLEVIAESIRLRTVVASDRLDRFRPVAAEASEAMKAGVLAALDELDRVTDRTRPSETTHS